jgi:hypothetical protein
MPVLLALLFCFAAAARAAEPASPMVVRIDWGGRAPEVPAPIAAAARRAEAPVASFQTRPYRHGEGLGYRPEVRPRRGTDYLIGSRMGRDWRSTNGIEHSWRTFQRTGKSMLGSYNPGFNYGNNIRYGTGAGYGFKK